jgi:hypothetical protein
MPIDPLPATDVAHFRLVRSAYGERYENDGTALGCPTLRGPALPHTEYRDPAFAPDERAPGVYRYHRWLPVRRSLPHTGRTVVRCAGRLGAILGVLDPWIAFNGYWPEWGADLTTCSFRSRRPQPCPADSRSRPAPSSWPRPETPRQPSLNAARGIHPQVIPERCSVRQNRSRSDRGHARPGRGARTASDTR